MFNNEIVALIDLLNNNQGVIAVIGLFFIIPLSIFSDKIISKYRRNEQRKELKRILLKELWININFVAQIEKSYINNLKDKINLHIPHYPPRTEILGKFFEFDLLNSLNDFEKEDVIEIYAQLKDLKDEYFLWRNLMINNRISADEKLYINLSSTMISYVDPVMRNMLDLWIFFVKDIGAKSPISQIKELNELILKKIKDGKWIRTSYMASFYNRDEYKEVEKFDIILCWENDWKDSPKEVIEVKNIIAIHESWTK